jgi:capsular polysaccharide biosynthesis protein
MADNKSSFLDADDLRPISKFIGKNWYLLFIFPAIAFFVAWFYTHGLPDVYAAKSEILLKSSDTYDYQNQIYSNLGYGNLIQDVTNQKRVIQSYDLISKALKKLDYTQTYYLVGRVKTMQVDGFPGAEHRL